MNTKRKRNRSNVFHQALFRWISCGIDSCRDRQLDRSIHLLESFPIILKIGANHTIRSDFLFTYFLSNIFE